VSASPEPAALTPLTPRQEEVKARFIEVRGTWSEAWEAVVRLDPDFLEAYLRFSAVPWRHGPLPAKVKEFIYIAIDANATHMYLPGVRQHIKAALDHGATGAEIMEVLELTATLGIHAMNVGMPVLAEVLRELGRLPASPELPELDARQREIKEEFTRVRGYWHSSWDDTLRFAPELLAAYLEFSGVPWRGGTLEPKVKEFIYIAFDVAATHLYRTGLKIHVANALGYGATPEEITEVMEIAAVLGVHAVTTSAPLLAEELAARAHTTSDS
jgi:alkylhydroperoxidase/carboxymuconolactone decarboxylase family protein YurZ